jgi:transcriptional regulator with XRE-family HTH domain
MEEAPKRSAQSFGAYLRDFRVQKGIDLASVSKITRISEGTLMMLEEEQQDRFPPDVFVFGFLRAYAKAIGADDNEAVALFRRSRGMREPVRLWVPEEDTGGGANRLKIVLAVLILLALIAGTAIVVMPGDRDPAVPPVAMRVPAMETPDYSKDKRVVPNTGKTMLLKMVAIENVRIKGGVDAQEMAEYKLLPGDSLEFEGRSRFHFLVDPASGVRVEYNGAPMVLSAKGSQPGVIMLP